MCRVCMLGLREDVEVLVCEWVLGVDREARLVDGLVLLRVLGNLRPRIEV